MAAFRFPSPLSKPEVPISGIRLSDWFITTHAAVGQVARGEGDPLASFRLVEREPELGHHRLRPRHGLGRVSATEDDEVVLLVSRAILSFD
jgi:hypothetical protein